VLAAGRSQRVGHTRAHVHRASPALLVLFAAARACAAPSSPRSSPPHGYDPNAQSGQTGARPGGHGASAHVLGASPTLTLASPAQVRWLRVRAQLRKWR
jgi:hypothetical protein